MQDKIWFDIQYTSCISPQIKLFGKPTQWKIAMGHTSSKGPCFIAMLVYPNVQYFISYKSHPRRRPKTTRWTRNRGDGSFAAFPAKPPWKRPIKNLGWNGDCWFVDWMDHWRMIPLTFATCMATSPAPSGFQDERLGPKFWSFGALISCRLDEPPPTSLKFCFLNWYIILCSRRLL